MNKQIRINGKLYEAVYDSSMKNFKSDLRSIRMDINHAIDEANDLGLDDTDLTNAFSYVDSFLRDLEY